MRLDGERYRTKQLLRPSFLAKRLLRLPTLDRDLYRDSRLTASERSHLEETVESAQKNFGDRRLLFIFAPMPRSGTNFLYELLLRVPGVEQSRIPFAELPILAGEEYFEGPRELIGRVHSESRDAFGRMEWMAYAISGFRNRVLELSSPGSVTLIKDPHVWNIELCPIFFPQDHIVVIVRDLRYVVDSYIRTFARRRFSRTFRDVCIESALAAEKTLKFLASPEGASAARIRFEDAVRDKAAAVESVQALLGDTHPRVDSSVLEEVPVLGSSTHSRGQGGAVHWSPVAADSTFDPVARDLNWTSEQRKVFENVCGAVNRRMGYPGPA